MAQAQTGTSITKVATVLVPVEDQDRALDFYVNTLGFEKRTDVPYGNGERWVEVGPRGGETTVALVRPMQGGPAPVRGQGNTSCTFYTEDIDRDHEHLKSHGVDVDAQVMRMGAPVPPMFFFRDQDGNSLLLVGAL
jgi:catechol 2,3-dioxygenase-like lactoylglutathione lyase family enzyme